MLPPPDRCGSSWTAAAGLASFAMRHAKFNESEDLKLIECVKCRPELYDSQHENYKTLYVKDKIWSSISTDVGRDVDGCKKRWKDMKDHYFKIKRKQKLELDTAAPVRKPTWTLYDPLSFLTDGCREKESFSNLKSECVIKQENCLPEEEVDRSSVASYTSNSESFYGFNTEPPDEPPSNSQNQSECYTQLVRSKTKKRKEVEVIQENTQRTLELLETLAKKRKIEQDDDDVDMFMKSVAVTLKKLPPLLIAQAKMSILSTVSMLQFSAQSFRGDTVSAPENTVSVSSVNENTYEKQNLSKNNNNV